MGRRARAPAPRTALRLRVDDARAPRPGGLRRRARERGAGDAREDRDRARALRGRRGRLPSGGRTLHAEERGGHDLLLAPRGGRDLRLPRCHGTRRRARDGRRGRGSDHRGPAPARQEGSARDHVPRRTGALRVGAGCDPRRSASRGRPGARGDRGGALAARERHGRVHGLRGGTPAGSCGRRPGSPGSPHASPTTARRRSATPAQAAAPARRDERRARAAHDRLLRRARRHARPAPGRGTREA